jgi:hypothetical protein
MSAEKVVFASLAWIDVARSILQELVAEKGEPGRAWSLCERFANAPPEVAASGLAAWHFRIDGKNVSVGPGEIDDADVTISSDYQTTLPAARAIYSPDLYAERVADHTPRPGVDGDLSNAPPYLLELHNRLAALTA